MKLPLIVLVLAFLLISAVILAPVDVTVCHATGSPTNPYVKIVVSVHSVDDATGLNGHGDHVDDAWQSFVFEDVTYPGQNESLFNTIIDADCNLIEPTPTPTNTEVPSATPTETETPTATPTATATENPTATGTPTDTATPTSTQTPDPSQTATPTETQPTPTQTANPTATPTITPRPPIPAVAHSINQYPGKYLGTIFMDKHTYVLYQGVNASNGTLGLPSAVRAAALYENTIWVHRAWNSGWLHLKTGDIVAITLNGNIAYYRISSTETLPYGVYPSNNALRIATCMSADGQSWTNVELFTLKLLKLHKMRK